MEASAVTLQAVTSVSVHLACASVTNLECVKVTFRLSRPSLSQFGVQSENENRILSVLLQPWNEKLFLSASFQP